MCGSSLQAGTTDSPSSIGSEVKLQAELKGAATGGAGDCAEAAAAQRRTHGGASVRREEELWGVGYAKSLEAQIQIVAFCKADGLGQCRVQVEEAWPAEIVPPHVAERSACRSCETRGAEPRVAGADAVKD